MGVSARRLRKPLWMSRARSVPAVHRREQRALHERDGEGERDVASASESPAAWSPREPARVDREQQPAGRRTGGITCAGWRGLPAHNPRRRSAPAISRRGGRRARAVASSSPRRALEQPAGLRKKDVVEARRMQAQVPDADMLRVKGAHDTRREPSMPSRRRTATAVGEPSTDSPKRDRISASRARCQPGGAGTGLDRRASNLRLQPRRSPLGDDPAVVDDPDPVGERVGLLRCWVVRDEGDAVRPLASRKTSCQSALRLCGSRPVVGSSRKRIRGRVRRGQSARSSRRFIPPE